MFDFISDRAVVGILMCIIGLQSYPLLISVERLAVTHVQRFAWIIVAIFGVSWFGAGIATIGNRPYQSTLTLIAHVSTLVLIAVATYMHNRLSRKRKRW